MPEIMTSLTRKLLPAPKVTVDYPQQNEKIASAQYAVRVGAPEDVKSVEVAVDQGSWLPCRKAVGYWWYDWSGYGKGEHEIVARIETQEGKRISSEPREFFVVQPLAPASN